VVALADAPSRRVVMRLPARSGSVPLARRAVSELCSALGIGPDVTADIQIAVSEACANAVVHAYVDTEPGDFEVEAEPAGAQLLVAIRDFGRGLRPRLDSPGIGVGLPLMASLAAALELRGEPGAGLTEVLMRFDCPGLA
jgi:anti-sigma regulatory factor (Ser/Thr protein kinase)